MAEAPTRASTIRLQSLIDRADKALPEGAIRVGVGLVINGLALYGFVAIATRALDQTAYATVSVLLAAVVIVGPGIFQPLEQEVSRAIANRRAHDLGGGPVVKKAGMLGFGLASLLVVASLVALPLVLDRLFDGVVPVYVGFLVALYGFCLGHLTRGTLSGNGRFPSYAVYFGAEGTVRVLGAVLLVALGVATAGRFGLIIGLAPFAATAIALWGQKGLIKPGPEARWSEVTTALGWLLMGSLLTGFMVGVGPLAVRILAPEDQLVAPGIFLNGLILARVPLFCFQAIQATLLPKLSGLASAGRIGEFKAGLRRLLLLLGMVAIIGTGLAALLGPWAMRIVFGPAYEMSSRDLGLLAAASTITMIAIALDQSLIALKGHRYMALGWLIGSSTFVVVTALGHDLFLRVEVGLLAGATASACAMATFLTARLGRVARAEVDVIDVRSVPASA